MNIRSVAVFLIAIACAVAPSLRAANNQPPPPIQRERLLMDFGWKFHLGNEWGSGQNRAKAGSGYGPASVTFSDASWRMINLPHDWAIELPFDQTADIGHGFKPLGPGFSQNNVGWYRKTFNLGRADMSRRLWLEFDGVYRNCLVYVNGWCVATNASGYSGFRCDITDVANYAGKNVVAIRVDASEPEGWFYEGAGIYRHVWLVKTAGVAVSPDGIFVQSSFRNNVPGGPALVETQIELANTTTSAADTAVMWELTGPDGQLLARGREPVRIDPVASTTLRYSVRVDAPELWSPETPKLYKMAATIVANQQTVDKVETVFGLRTVAFDAERGFLLNGQPYVIKGTCNHQDHAGVGVALPDRLQYFRIAKLKEMGSNAYRTSHNPPTPELLDACDRLGMLVMDENRLLGSDPANMDLLERLVRRDRNHPSVVIWSIANEEFGVQGTPAGRRVGSAMQSAIRKLDTTRPITYAAPVGDEFPGINEIIEVRGWNYHVGTCVDDYHAAHPKQPNVGTEQASTLCTRGIYANDPLRGYVSAYDVNFPPWGNSAQEWWSFYQLRPWLSGGFVWTGFDYRGEPTPSVWPCISSHFGIFDTCGFPKDNFWYYRSWWQSEPVLHLLPHWNWVGHEGEELEVRALSNCDEVELFLNGQSLGRQTMARNGQLAWKVKYAPGILSAKGFRMGREVVAEKVETTGGPAAVLLTPDRAVIDANGEDLAVVTVAVADSAGRIVPYANNLVSFSLEGPGRILGVGNGDPSCHEPDTFVPTTPAHTVNVATWRAKEIAEAFPAAPAEVAEGCDDSSWQVVKVDGISGDLPAKAKAYYRAHFKLTAEEAAQPVIELSLGRVDGGGTVYVNGQKAGPSGDARAPSVFDLKKFARAGDNVVAVAVENFNMYPAGLSGGATVLVQGEATPASWSRSVFNGYAQILVQASKEAGELKLTAMAGGLKSGTVVIQAKPAAPRAAVP